MAVNADSSAVFEDKAFHRERITELDSGIGGGIHAELVERRPPRRVRGAWPARDREGAEVGRVRQTLLREGLGRVREVEIVEPKIPTSVDEVKDLSMDELALVIALSCANEIRAVADGGDSALRSELQRWEPDTRETWLEPRGNLLKPWTGVPCLLCGIRRRLFTFGAAHPLN